MPQVEQAGPAYDLFNRDAHERCFELYRELRDDAPVFRTPSGFWVISRYDDVAEAIRDGKRYSNSPNQSESMGMATADDPAVGQARIDQMDEMLSGLGITATDLMNATMIQAADPPKHTHMRGIVNRGFTARRIRAWQDVVEKLVLDALDGLDGSQSFDVMQRVAVAVPIAVIGDVLGVEPENRPKLKQWTDGILRASMGEDRGTAAAHTRQMTALTDFARYFLQRIEERRQRPGEDLISDLVRAEDAATLSRADTLFFILVVMAAGNETSTNMIGNMVVSLYENPEELELVLADESLIPGVVEETLRYRSPVQMVLRKTVTDVDVAGVTIPAGESLALLLGSANRDERQYEDPDAFRVTRANAGTHLALGHGIHFCIGNALARLEGAVSLKHLLPRLQRMRIDDTVPLQRAEQLMLYGYEQIPLVPR